MLARTGLEGFRPRIRARVRCFFGTKKGNKRRLVIEARGTNHTRHAPLHAALGTPGALADQDWSESAIAFQSGFKESPPAEAHAVFGAILDLRDGLYQLTSNSTAEDFGFDFPKQATVREVTSYWSALGPVPESLEQELFPVFRAVPMGWNRALWAVCSTVAHCRLRRSEAPSPWSWTVSRRRHLQLKGRPLPSTSTTWWCSPSRPRTQILGWLVSA